VELGEWTSERERDAARLEHRGDDIAACFLLEEALLEGGYEQVFSGEVTGLIAAGVFVAFAPGAASGAGESENASRPIYEGMLPVRLLTLTGTPSGAQAGSAGEERDWWALNEQSTILRGERSGATLRLGDPIDVRVVRVDASGGRVDLAPAG
jgi:ribonuclease R